VIGSEVKIGNLATGGTIGRLELAASDAAEVRWFRREELPVLKPAEDTPEVIGKSFAKAGVGS
jgi:hypothetical protein